MEAIQSLIKALEAGNYDAAPSKLVQGSALMIEDISSVINVTTYNDEHIFLQREIEVSSSKSVLAQFDRQLSYGTFGGSARTEGKLGDEQTSDYVRITYPMCFYSELRRVTIPSMLVETVDGKKSDERAATDAAKKLAGDIEFDIFRGKADFSNDGVFDAAPSSLAVGPSLTGVDVQVRQSDLMRNAHDLMFDSYGSDESIVIAAGGVLTQDNLEDAHVRSAMNMGKAETMYLDPRALSHYNKLGFAKERIVLAGSPQSNTGSSLDKQFTSGGSVKLRPSRFLSAKTSPHRSTRYAPAAPGTLVTASAAHASGAVSPFVAGEVYTFTATANSEHGESVPATPVTATVAADGDALTLTIPHAGLPAEVAHFDVYRSAAGSSKMAFIGRVKINESGSSTVFTDLGNKNPRSITGFLLDTDTFEIKELAPFSRLKLAVTELSQPEAFFRFLALGARQPRQNVLVDNIAA